MMGYGYNYGGMFGGGTYVFCVITWLVVMVDLVLAGMWLWKQIKKPYRGISFTPLNEMWELDQW